MDRNPQQLSQDPECLTCSREEGLERRQRIVSQTTEEISKI